MQAFHGLGLSWSTSENQQAAHVIIDFIRCDDDERYNVHLLAIVQYDLYLGDVVDML